MTFLLFWQLGSIRENCENLISHCTRVKRFSQSMKIQFAKYSRNTLNCETAKIPSPLLPRPLVPPPAPPTHVLHSNLLAPVERPAAGKAVQVPQDAVSHGHSQSQSARRLEGEGLHSRLVPLQQSHLLARLWGQGGRRVRKCKPGVVYA